jgi:hypothetical protein
MTKVYYAGDEVTIDGQRTYVGSQIEPGVTSGHFNTLIPPFNARLEIAILQERVDKLEKVVSTLSRPPSYTYRGTYS